MTDNLQLYNSIHNCDPWEESFEKSLREYNFIEPKKAWKNIHCWMKARGTHLNG